MTSPLLVRVDRGPLTESVHHGRIVAIRHTGEQLAVLGDAAHPTFARSAAKPLQAVAVVESGAVERYGLTPEQIALMCASHNGEPEHVQIASRMLAQIGLGESDLQCGPHEPYHEPSAKKLREQHIAPTRLHNNCSGKHAGMLTLATWRGDNVAHYMAVNHPVQRAMLDAVSALSDTPAEQIPLGTDGCGVPVFGLPLERLALAYATLGRPDRLTVQRAAACRMIIDAIRRHPAALAGNDRFDTQLNIVTKGRIIGKMGAEGVFALTVPEQGTALAVKIDDGSMRALYPVVVEALIQLDWLTDAEASALQSFHNPPLTNWSGTVVGSIAPSFSLTRSS